MSTLTQSAARVLAVAVLVLGVGGCAAAATSTAAAGATPSVVSSVPVDSPLDAGPSGVPGPVTASSTTGSAAVAASASGSALSGDCKKVRFALHAGLGTGAVHRYLWEPYLAGAFAAGAEGRGAALAKASLAGAFAVHEFTVAVKDVAGCPGTQALTAAVRSGLDRAAALVAGLRSGTVDATVLAGVNDQLAAIERQAEAAGLTVAESDPSAVQLATGDTGD